MKKLICLYLLINLSSFFSCNESPNKPESPNPINLLPEQALVTINWPANLPAQALDYQGEAMGSLTATFNYFESARGIFPNGQHPNWTWRINFDPFIVIINATVLDDDEVDWEINLEAPDLPKRLLSKGKTDSVGNSGSFDFYDAENVIFASTTWYMNDQKKLEINTQRSPREYDIIRNPDNSGSLLVKQRDVKIYEAAWDATGAGTWISYDPITGQQTNSGSWTS